MPRCQFSHNASFRSIHVNRVFKKVKCVIKKMSYCVVMTHLKGILVDPFIFHITLLCFQSYLINLWPHLNLKRKKQNLKQDNVSNSLAFYVFKTKKKLNLNTPECKKVLYFYFLLDQIIAHFYDFCLKKSVVGCRDACIFNTFIFLDNCLFYMHKKGSVL